MSRADPPSSRVRERPPQGPIPHEDGRFGTMTRDAYARSGWGTSGGRGQAGCTIALELDNGPSAAAEARAVLTMLDGHTAPELLDDVRLLVSELVTNAVRHSGSPEGAKVGLRIAASTDRVRVEVTDAGGGFEPRPRTAGQHKGSGWGLHLVDRLAARWGVSRAGTPLVWFELDAAG